MSFEIKKGSTNRYKKIIIKYDDKISFTYSLNTYNEYPFLQNFVSKENFTEILDKANIIIYSAKMKKAKFDKVEVNNITYILIIISCIFTIIFIFLFYFTPRVNSHQTDMKIFGIFFFCAALLILICLEIFFSLQKIQPDKTLFHFYKNEIMSYIDTLNKKWKDVMFFKFDKSNKNIICFVRINKEEDETEDKTVENIIISKRKNE